MKLLALDLSKKVGSCYMVRGLTPDFDTLDLEKYPTLHERLGRYGDWLTGYYRTRTFHGIAWEQPLLMQWDTRDQLLLLYGLVAITRRFAWCEHLPWQEVTVYEGKEALGVPRFPKGTKKSILKQASVTAAYKLGWEVLDHHQAEAGGVGLVAYPRIWPKQRAMAL